MVFCTHYRDTIEFSEILSTVSARKFELLTSGPGPVQSLLSLPLRKTFAIFITVEAKQNSCHIAS